MVPPPSRYPVNRASSHPTLRVLIPEFHTKMNRPLRNFQVAKKKYCDILYVHFTMKTSEV